MSESAAGEGTEPTRDSGRFHERVVSGSNPLADLLSDDDEPEGEELPFDSTTTALETKEVTEEKSTNSDDDDLELELPPPIPVPSSPPSSSSPSLPSSSSPSYSSSPSFSSSSPPALGRMPTSPLLKSLQDKVFKQGWLMKSSTKEANSGKKFMGRSVDMWKKRWVALTLDGVRYYKTEEDYKANKPLGNVALGVGFDVVSESDCVLCVTANGRSLSLKAPTTELRNEWVTAFDYLRQMQVDGSVEATQAVEQRLERLEELKPSTEVQPTTVELFKQGWLYKQGGTASKARISLGRSSWKKRFMVLNSNGLSYYDTEEGFKAGQHEIAFIAVDHSFDFKVDEKEKDKPDISFSLISTERTLPLRADTKEVRDEWFGAMRALRSQREKYRKPSVKPKVAVAADQPIPQLADDKFVDKNSIREGYLTKHGGRGMSKIRYFVLYPGELRYYKNPKETTAIGSIMLDSKSIVQPSKDSSRTFFVVPVPNGKIYELIAKDYQDEINWLDSFRVSQPAMNIFRRVETNAPLHEADGFKKSTRSIKEGYMLKQGHINKSWKRRYFVLEPTLLQYFKNPTDKECKGQVALGQEGDFVSTDTDIRITISAGNKQTILTCESPVECLAWLNAFQTVKKITVHSHLIITPLTKQSSSSNLLSALSPTDASSCPALADTSASTILATAVSANSGIEVADSAVPLCFET